MIACFDIETLVNAFTATFVEIKTGVASSFVVHRSRNDFGKMVDYLRGVKGLVGFNNVDFDYAVLHPFLMKGDFYAKMDGDELARLIYKRSQEVINEDFRKDYSKPLIPQRDLYRIWHFNNKARATSLKFLQINMDWKNVQEMPIKHYEEIGEDKIQDVLDYNLNDVLTTIEFYNRTKEKIIMRNTLGKRYSKDFGNASDTKIGEAIFLLEMARRTGKSEKELSSHRTHRKSIAIKDCIVPQVKFESPEFNRILKEFQGMVISKTRKQEGLFVYFDGMKYEFGFGGLHAFRESGVYKNITSADVASYYPNLAIGQRFYPLHLGEVFCDVYEHLYLERKKYPKGSDESNAIKLALNGVYGMSNAEWSPFYDPKYTMSITITGQLLLAMLCERITLSGAGRIIVANTDGIELEVYDETKLQQIAKEWQEENKLVLEFGKYRVLALRDVNNYIGVKETGEIKEKGDYVCDREIYKDQSMRIVTQAVREYFVNNVPIEKTIGDCTDIKLFLMGKRAKTGNLEFRRAEKLGELTRQKLPKNVRYYISKTGGSVVKLLTAKKKIKPVQDNQMSLFSVNDAEEVVVERVVNLHVGWRQTLFNLWVDKPFEEYGVEKQFYITEAKKLIDSIVKVQTEIK